MARHAASGKQIVPMVGKRPTRLIHDIALAVPGIVYSIAIFFFVRDRFAISSFPLDDAWIHQIYARSLAHGHGFAFNPGQQEAGSTSPLWAVFTAPAHWLEACGTLAVVIAVKLLGIVLGFAVLLAIARIARRLTGSDLIAGLAASLMAVEPRLLFAALSGMEPILLVAVWTWALAAILDGRGVAFLVLIGLAPLARPEALILLPLSILAIPAVIRRPGPIWRKVTLLAIPVLPQIAWSSFCLYANGHVLPNTVYLKTTPFQFGAKHFSLGWQALTQQGVSATWAFPVGLVMFACWCLLAKNRKAALGCVFLVIMPAAYLCGVLGTRRIFLLGFYWTRWLDPACLVLTIAFCIGWAWLGSLPWQRAEPGGRAAGASRPLTVVAGALGVAVLLVSIPEFARTFADRRLHLSADSRAIDIINVGMGNWIHNHTPADVTVAVNDAGAIRYFGQRRTIDLVGLNNAPIAFGAVSLRDAILAADWLAIFPGWLGPTGLMPFIHREFEAQEVIKIPPEEYTVCPAAAQTVNVAYRRKTANSAAR